jgi:hypothetical protein
VRSVPGRWPATSLRSAPITSTSIKCGTMKDSSRLDRSLLMESARAPLVRSSTTQLDKPQKRPERSSRIPQLAFYLRRAPFGPDGTRLLRPLQPLLHRWPLRSTRQFLLDEIGKAHTFASRRRLQSAMDVFRNVPHLDHLRHVPSIETCAAHVHPSSPVKRAQRGPIRLQDESRPVLNQPGRFTRISWFNISGAIVTASWIRCAWRMKSGSKVQMTMPA